MKGIKRGLYIVVFIISLFIINITAKAYTILENDTVTINEEFIYNNLSTIDGFDIKEHSKIFCRISSNYLYCYALSNEVSFSKYNVKFLQCNNLNSVSNLKIFMFSYNISNNTFTTNTLTLSYQFNPNFKDSPFYSNFKDFEYENDENTHFDVLDFSKYMSSQEEPVNPEINIKATKLLDFMIDKIKNIYEVLINNEIFKFILSIPLIYLCFLALSKLIKK